ncbi:MAG: hypothetical protein HY399_07225 [Elusimicrobia bacterium]|nr:hypothetical protein [Elusimicrobiota bacterium]
MGTQRKRFIYPDTDGGLSNVKDLDLNRNHPEIGSARGTYRFKFIFRGPSKS